MKKAIHNWALPTYMSLEQKLQFTKKCGYDGFEPVVIKDGAFSIKSKEKELHLIRKMASDIGIILPSITNSLSWESSLTSEHETIRKKAFDNILRTIDIAYEVGIPAILALPGFVSMDFNSNSLHPAVTTSLEDLYSPSNEIIRYDKAYERALNSFLKLSDYAKKANIIICIENTWSNFLLSPLEMKSFIDTINSSFVKIYFDVGNVRPYGIPEHWIEILEKRIYRVHLKDYKNGSLGMDGFTSLLKGNIDFSAIKQSLDTIGYDNWVTAELNVDTDNQEKVAVETISIINKIFK